MEAVEVVVTTRCPLNIGIEWRIGTRVRTVHNQPFAGGLSLSVIRYGRLAGCYLRVCWRPLLPLLPHNHRNKNNEDNRDSNNGVYQTVV